MKVQGTRVTLTVPPGELGNERPFDIVNEVWYSADLQAIVVSKHSDPRSGVESYRLVGITRSEPPTSLFKVPPEYTVTQMPPLILAPRNQGTNRRPGGTIDGPFGVALNAKWGVKR